MNLTDSHPSPIAQLRHAARSPVALALGAALGAFVPVATYTVVHSGSLLDLIDETTLRWLRWAQVLGGLTVSAKTVYQWFLQAFRGDRAKAFGYVLLVEGALMLSPVPELSYAALALLVLVNAFGAGSGLGEAELREAVPATTPKPAREARQTPPTQLSLVSQRPVPPPLPPPLPVKPAGHDQVVRASPPQPAPAALPSPKPDDVQVDRYTRAIEVVRSESHISTEMLRRALSCRQPEAASIIQQLEADGVVGQPDPSARGRRPVLLRAEG